MTGWQDYDPRQQRPQTPPQFRPATYAPRYQPPQQPWQPPKRKPWVRRHKVLTSLLCGGVLVVAVVVVAAARSAPGAKVADLAACTSHKAVSAHDWELVAKSPDAHKGECLTLYGEVTQADSVTGDSLVRASVGGALVKPQFGFVSYPTNVIVAAHDGNLASLVQGDLFTMQVTVAGSQQYETALGGKTTVPLLRADSVTRTGHLNL